MNKFTIRLLAVLTATISTTFAANKLLIASPETLQWHLANGLPGAQVAVLSGNPEKHEPFIARVKLPENFQIPVHSHQINEYDTVISGALYVGIGSTFNTNNTQKISAGSFIMIPAKLKHYAWTKEETILQVNGVGPWGMLYKNK